jgi:hypothetical protein
MSTGLVVRPPLDDTSSVAVRRRLGDQVVADGGGRARLVLHDEALLQLFLQLLGHQPREDVVGAARREADDDLHRLVRIGLGGGLRGVEGQRGERDGGDTGQRAQQQAARGGRTLGHAEGLLDVGMNGAS